MDTQLTQEMELEAREMALMMVDLSPSVEIDELLSTLMLLDMTLSDFLTHNGLSEFAIIVKACRRSVIDGFPLEEYFFLYEEPIGINCTAAHFVEIDEYDFFEVRDFLNPDVNPNAHEIVFFCFEDENVAIPWKPCDGGTCYKKQANCFEAVYLRRERDKL